MTAEVEICPQAQSNTPPPTRTVLIIEDEVDSAAALASGLTREGHRTLTAHTGQRGLLLARTERPDVILLDLGLPDADGLAIGRELSDSPETADVPIIAITAHGGADLLRKVKAAGFWYYLRKPFDPSALSVLIDSVSA
jgi:DNA-binding response OmpR family regulator